METNEPSGFEALKMRSTSDNQIYELNRSFYVNGPAKFVIRETKASNKIKISLFRVISLCTTVSLALIRSWQ